MLNIVINMRPMEILCNSYIVLELMKYIYGTGTNFRYLHEIYWNRILDC